MTERRSIHPVPAIDPTQRATHSASSEAEPAEGDWLETLLHRAAAAPLPDDTGFTDGVMRRLSALETVTPVTPVTPVARHTARGPRERWRLSGVDLVQWGGLLATAGLWLLTWHDGVALLAAFDDLGVWLSPRLWERALAPLVLIGLLWAGAVERLLRE